VDLEDPVVGATGFLPEILKVKCRKIRLGRSNIIITDFSALLPARDITVDDFEHSGAEMLAVVQQRLELLGLGIALELLWQPVHVGVHPFLQLQPRNGVTAGQRGKTWA
jgi:hypothetical protein